MKKKNNTEVKPLPREYTNQRDLLVEFDGYGASLNDKSGALLFDKSMVQDVCLIMLDIAIYPEAPTDPKYAQSYILLIEMPDKAFGMVVIGGEFLTPCLEKICNKRKSLIPFSFVLRKKKSWSIYPAKVETE